MENYIVKFETADKKEDTRYAVVRVNVGLHGDTEENCVARTHKKKLALELCYALNNTLIWMMQ